MYAYKLVLHVIVLAFTSLKVKVMVKGLNDAKYITAATSVTSIVLTVILFSHTLKDFVNVYSALICTGLFIGTTSILGLIFVPKVKWIVSVHVSFKICIMRVHSPLLKPQ